MKKVLLSEEQFDALVRRELNESIYFGGECAEDKKGSKDSGNPSSKRNVGDVIKYLKGVYNSKDDSQSELRDNLRYLADIDSVNFNYSKKGKEAAMKSATANKSDEIKQWVLKYLPVLRLCWEGNNFRGSKEMAKYDSKTGEIYNSRTSWDDVFDKNTGDYLKRSYDNLSVDEQKNVQYLQAFLDKANLGMLYRDAQRPASVFFSCGLELDKVNKNTPIEYLEKNLNFSGMFDKGYEGAEAELDKEYDGTKVKTFKSKLGREPNEEEIEQYKLSNFAQKKARRYTMMTYGVGLEFGGAKNDMFKFGNHKIAGDTLIVNFTSAMRCPAWNECIMKDACYAKTSEKNYDATLSSNLKKDLVWRQTEKDPTLMGMMMAVLRSYLIDYYSLPFVKEIPTEKGRNDAAVALSRKTLYDIEKEYGQEAIDILTETKRGTLIRLNENGDFIGQWLVDAFEEFANELGKVGINITAYTCRALNYESVKKMILNISQMGLVRNQKSAAFAHFFYAIEPSDYKALGETYGGPNYSLDFNKDTQKITPVYRKMVDEDGILKGYYYKCPCGRGAFGYVSYEGSATAAVVDGITYDPKTQTFNGETKFMGNTINAAAFTEPKGYKFTYIIDRVANIGYTKNGNSNSYSVMRTEYNNVDFGHGIPFDITNNDPKIYINMDDGKIYEKKATGRKESTADCYMCRICYARDKNDVRYEGGNKEEGVPVYVFVATHGANRNEFQSPEGRKIHKKDAGQWAKIISMHYPQKGVLRGLNEDLGNQESPIDNTTARAIGRNFIWSLARRMGSLLRLNEVKEKFKSFINRMDD